MSDVSDGEIVDEAMLNGKAAAPAAAAAAAPALQLSGSSEAAAAPANQHQPSGSPVSPQAADSFFEVDPHDPGARLSGHHALVPLAAGLPVSIR